MKVLVINGSPKRKSDTMCLTRAFLEGLNATGEHDMETVDLIEKKVGPCVGCFACWKNGDGKCVIDDYQNVLLDKLRAADTVILSFPLYCCSMPSHFKAFVDRMLPLSRDDRKNKRFLAVVGSGFPIQAVNFDAVKTELIHMFGRIRVICVYQTPLLHAPGMSDITAPLLKRFTEAGEEFGRRTYLYRETVEALEKPMLTNDEYVEAYKKIAGGSSIV